MAENLQRVRSFINAWKRNDLDEIMSFFAEDCVYHNIPLEPMKGAKAIRAALDGFMQMLGAIEIDTKLQIAVGDTVMNERIDTFSPPGKGRYGLPVAGVFVVKNGKITVWRDYFDTRQFANGTGIAL